MRQAQVPSPLDFCYLVLLLCLGIPNKALNASTEKNPGPGHHAKKTRRV